MKTKTLSLTSFLSFFGLMLLIHSFNSFAGPSAIECKTSFEEKSFTIYENHVSFQKQDESGVYRSISSTSSHAVRTQKKYMGFTKTLYINGYKHRISIENTNEFSDVNDYLSITSPKGHEMTYPLNCHSV